MYLRNLLSLGVFVVVVAADWSTQQWDAIIVGAGPAGIIGKLPIDIQNAYSSIEVANRMAAAGLQTLLIEGGGPSYGVTGGDLNSRRPVCIPIGIRVRF